MKVGRMGDDSSFILPPSSLARGCSLMVKPQPSKLATWVRFPSPASLGRVWLSTVHRSGESLLFEFPPKVGVRAAVAQLVERVLGKDEVLGSNPSSSFQGITVFSTLSFRPRMAEF